MQNHHINSVWHWHSVAIFPRDSVYHGSVDHHPATKNLPTRSDWVSLVVTDLLPLSAIEFRLAAFNVIGEGPLSTSSALHVPRKLTATGFSVSGLLRMALRAPNLVRMVYRHGPSQEAISSSSVGIDDRLSSIPLDSLKVHYFVAFYLSFLTVFLCLYNCSILA